MPCQKECSELQTYQMLAFMVPMENKTTSRAKSMDYDWASSERCVFDWHTTDDRLVPECCIQPIKHM